MDDSLYNDNITGRWLIQHASQEVPMLSSPLPMLQHLGSKRSTKRRRSAMAAARPSIDPGITPRTLIQNTHREKIMRRSSPPAVKENEIFQLRHERSRSLRSHHEPVDTYDEISVDENETTEEGSCLPDMGNLSAITSHPKKKKLQLGKLDSRAYLQKKQKKNTYAVDESFLDEEYNENLPHNTESRIASTHQGKSRTSVDTEKAAHKLPNDKGTASGVNFNTKVIRGSPLREKQKPFSEKLIPHLSSDSDATLQSFPHKLGAQQKARKSILPCAGSNVLSDAHLLKSSLKPANTTSNRHSAASKSSTEAPLKGKNILSHSLHIEGLNVSPLPSRRSQTFAGVPRGEESSGDFDADEESLDGEEEAGEPEEILKTAAHSIHQKSSSRNVPPKHSTGVLSSKSMHPGSRQVSPFRRSTCLVEKLTEGQISTFADDIQFIEMPKPTIPTSRENSISQPALSERAKRASSKLYNINEQEDLEVQEQYMHQISGKETINASRKVSNLTYRASSEIPAASPTTSKLPVSLSQNKSNSQARLSQGSLKAATAFMPYSVTSSKTASKSKASTDDVQHDSLSASLKEAEDYQSKSSSDDDVPQQPKQFNHSTILQQKSRSRNSVSHSTKTKSSLSYNIINQPDMDMDGTPQVLEDASYRPRQNRISGRNVVVSEKASYPTKGSEPEQPSPAFSLRSRISGSMKKMMHSTAINDPNQTAEGNFISALEDDTSQIFDQADDPSGCAPGILKKTSRTIKSSKQGQLTKPILSSRPSVSRSYKAKMHSDTMADSSGRWETVQEGTLVSESTSGQAQHQTEGSGQAPAAGASRKVGRTAKTSQSGRFASPIPSTSSPVSSSTRKKTDSVVSNHHNAALVETVARNSPQVLLEDLSVMPVTENARENSGVSLKKVTRSTKLRESEQSSFSEEFARPRVSESLKKKMHSTAIPDHNATMKTIQDCSVSMSPIQEQLTKMTESDKSQKQPVSQDHANSDIGDIESSWATDSEDESPDRMQGNELPLPAIVQDHDEELQSQGMAATRSQPSGKKQRAKNKKGVPRISAAETKKIVENFAGMKLSRGALNTVLESCDIFWENTYEALYDYSDHAGRDTIDIQDIELLLYRQRHAHDRNSMNALIARHMPMEYRRQIVPMATPGNIVIP